MKKTLTTLLIATGFAISCYSIPQFILDNQVTLTPEQKAEYERKVGERPDEYSFNPMHLNDMWWYSGMTSGEPLNHPITCYIIGDTLYNNIQHFKLFRPRSVNQWLVNDSSYVWMLDLDNYDNNPITEYLLMENYAQQVGVADTVVWGNSFAYCISMYTGYVNCFGEIVEFRSSYYSSMGSPVQASCWWARKYGLIAYELEDFYMYIIGAYINGQMHGSSTLSEDDTNTEISPKLDVDCYPNPFNTSTTISYSLPKDIQISLDIYNLKGQKVKTLQNEKRKAGQHSVVWSGTDDRRRPVSSGIYFYKLITPKAVLTNKMIIMK